MHGDKGGLECDYPKCPHKTRFRKDHCREHYREYHNEDLLKRSKPSAEKHKKEKDRKEADKKNSKRSQDKPEAVEEFLATRRHTDLSWWRCTKCIARVKVNPDGYMCSTCNIACEPERAAWRKKKEQEKALAPTKNSRVGL
jgi:hypothetical protein